jgi:ubiquinone biosynthesis protein COQ4
MARIRPLVARRAMKALRENPDDTAQAIKVIGALAGNSGKRQLKRFKRSPVGAQILREQRSLYSILSDIDRLLAMAPGSLGRTIGDWFVRENISAQGLAQAGEAAYKELGVNRTVSDEEQIFGSRMRDLHDVFHVVSGYDRDARGEMAVLALTVAQTRSPGMAYMVWSALRRSGWNSEMGKLIRQGFRRGMKAKWLVDQDWETLLEEPIDEVREKLDLGPPPVYEQARTAGAPPLPA